MKKVSKNQRVFERKNANSPLIDFLLCVILLCGSFLNAAWQTCNVSVQPGVADANFDAIFNQNGPGT